MTRDGRRLPAELPADLARLLLLPAICCFVLFGACDQAAAPPGESDVARTLASIRQVDGYPLYVMRYYGDYGAGARSSPEGPDAGTRSSLDGLDAGASRYGCTTFAALAGERGSILGRNFDWQNHMALLLYADPSDGFASVSMVDISYLGFEPGSGSEANKRKLLGAPGLPFDGMNERGLAVGMMAVPHAEGGEDPSKPTVGGLRAIRLMLDRAETVEQAVDLLRGYNIDFSGGPPLHYLICDAGRRAAVIEFRAGAMTVIPADTLWQAATNFVVAECAWTGSPSDCWRYNRTLEELRLRGGSIGERAAMDLLGSVSQANTMWSVVYGAGERTVLVAAGRRYDSIHSFTMEELRGPD